MAKGKAANGSGTIRLRPDGRYEARVVVGYDIWTREPIRKSIYAKTKSECARKLREVAVEVDHGTYVETKNMKLSQWLEIWLEMYTSSIRPGTLVSYKNSVNRHINPRLGKFKLSELKPHIIQRFIKELEKQSNPLSAKTIKNIHGTLHKALEEAVRVEYLVKNPADKTILPKVSKPKVKPFSGEEIDLFMHAIHGETYEDLFFTALWTGMRLSELLGLQWECVDFKKGTILIDKQLSWLRKEDAGRSLVKTKNGKERKISPPAEVLKHLQRVKRRQAEWQLKAGNRWNNEFGLVFTNKSGRNLSQTTVQHHFKRICRSIGLERHFHDTRHTFATEGIRIGIPIKTISDALGHYSTAFTMDVYGHTTEQMHQEAAERFQASISERLSSQSF